MTIQSFPRASCRSLALAAVTAVALCSCGSGGSPTDAGTVGVPAAGGGADDPGHGSGAQFNGDWRSTGTTFGGFTGTGIGTVFLPDSLHITDGLDAVWVSLDTGEEVSRQRIEWKTVPIYGDERWCLVDDSGNVPWTITRNPAGDRLVIGRPVYDGEAYEMGRSASPRPPSRLFRGVAN
jgi:hypothetical protein